MASEQTRWPVTSLSTGETFIVSAKNDGGTERDSELVAMHYEHCSRTPNRRGRYQLQCNCAHPGLAYLQKRHEGTPNERFWVCHFDGSQSHSTASRGESEEHFTQKHVIGDLAIAAGYEAEYEVELPNGGKADVLIKGPGRSVDGEIQRSHLKRSSAVARNRRNTTPGILPLWIADRITEWNERHSVPNIRTNEYSYGDRESWSVVSGMSSVRHVRCSALYGTLCPKLGSGKFCGELHLEPAPWEGLITVRNVIELLPRNELELLDLGRRGKHLVTAADFAKWNDEYGDNAAPVELRIVEHVGPQLPPGHRESPNPLRVCAICHSPLFGDADRTYCEGCVPNRPRLPHGYAFCDNFGVTDDFGVTCRSAVRGTAGLCSLCLHHQSRSESRERARAS